MVPCHRVARGLPHICPAYQYEVVARPGRVSPQGSSEIRAEQVTGLITMD